MRKNKSGKTTIGINPSNHWLDSLHCIEFNSNVLSKLPSNCPLQYFFNMLSCAIDSLLLIFQDTDEFAFEVIIFQEKIHKSFLFNSTQSFFFAN